MPTETVYGLAGNALDPRAVARIFEAKGRPHFDPLIVHLPSLSEISRVAMAIPDTARRLAEHFWPGPLTLILPRQACIPDLVTSGLETVAVRVPDHPLARQLLLESQLPLAAPSANLFGRISPTTSAHVAEQLGTRIDYILDGGPCRVGVESTVVDCSRTEATRVLRLGGITLEELTELAGPVEIAQTPDQAHPQAVASPGLLPQHYAPRTPLTMISRGAVPTVSTGQRVGYLAFEHLPTGNYAQQEVLSPTADLQIAAANFFAALRRLDAQGLDLILAEQFPEIGLGRALNDRLRRAAHA